MKPKMLAPILIFSAFALLIIDACQSPEVTSAKVYFQQDNLEAAEEQLLIALEKEPVNPEVPFLLATGVYVPQKRWMKAKEMLMKVKEIDPSYVNPMTKTDAGESLKSIWGELHTQGANLFNEALRAILPMEKDSLLKKAIDKFNLALEFNNDEIITYNGMVKCYYMLEDTASVIKWAETVADKGLFDEDIVNYQTQMLWAQGNKERALQVLDTALADNHDIVSLQELRIQYLAQMDRVEEAKEIASRLSREYPNNANLMYLLAQVYLITGDYESARYEFQKVLAQNPDDIDVLTRVAEASFQAEDWISAEQYARRIVELDSEYAYGYMLLWKALYNQGRPDEAEEYRQIEKSLR